MVLKKKKRESQRGSPGGIKNLFLFFFISLLVTLVFLTFPYEEIQDFYDLIRYHGVFSKITKTQIT